METIPDSYDRCALEKSISSFQRLLSVIESRAAKEEVRRLSELSRMTKRTVIEGEEPFWLDTVVKVNAIFNAIGRPLELGRLYYELMVETYLQAIMAPFRNELRVRGSSREGIIEKRWISVRSSVGGVETHCCTACFKKLKRYYKHGRLDELISMNNFRRCLVRFFQGCKVFFVETKVEMIADRSGKESSQSEEMRDSFQPEAVVKDTQESKRMPVEFAFPKGSSKQDRGFAEKPKESRQQRYRRSNFSEHETLCLLAAYHSVLKTGKRPGTSGLWDEVKQKIREIGGIDNVSRLRSIDIKNKWNNLGKQASKLKQTLVKKQYEEVRQLHDKLIAEAELAMIKGNNMREIPQLEGDASDSSDKSSEDSSEDGQCEPSQLQQDCFAMAFEV